MNLVGITIPYGGEVSLHHGNVWQPSISTGNDRLYKPSVDGKVLTPIVLRRGSFNGIPVTRVVPLPKTGDFKG